MLYKLPLVVLPKLFLREVSVDRPLKYPRNVGSNFSESIKVVRKKDAGSVFAIKNCDKPTRMTKPVRRE